MTSIEEQFEELWNDFLEGELDAQRYSDLQRILEEHPQLRTLAAESYRVHRLLCLGAQSNESSSEQFVRATIDRLPDEEEEFVQGVLRHISAQPTQRPSWSLWSTAAIAATLASILMLAVVFSINGLNDRETQPKPIATIVGLSGSLLWTGDAGRVSNALTVNDPLAGGTLEGLAPDSWIKLQFLDGSTVTMTGNSMLTFSEEVQKELHLRQGNIVVQASKQPPGKPMLVHTRSATLEVVGTQFHVDAELTSTFLNVNEGSVRVKSLADGQSVDVQAQQRVVASADKELVPTPVPDSVNAWTSQLALGPAESLGNWLPPEGPSPARLAAIPFVYRPPEKNADPITLFLTSLAITRGDERPVLIESQSAFRVRGQIQQDRDVYFGFQVNHRNGEFAGKYLAQLHAGDNENSDSRDIMIDRTITYSEFVLDPSVAHIRDRLPENLEGLVVSSCWCFTVAQSAGLEISHVAIGPEQSVSATDGHPHSD